MAQKKEEMDDQIVNISNKYTKTFINFDKLPLPKHYVQVLELVDIDITAYT
jgi:hypothetical protein